MMLGKNIFFVLLFIAIMFAYKMDALSEDHSGLLLDGDNDGESRGGCQSGNGGGGSCNIKISGGSKQKASSIALKAAQEAKAASDSQVAAAEAAARQVKQQLAEKAFAAAKAAEAALAGKQQIVEQLETEVHEGELVVHEEGTALQTTQATCAAASAASTQSGLQLKALTDAVKNAKDNVQNSELAASGAMQELGEKQQLVEAAKKRVELLLKQLESAKSDFKNTKKAAERAACAAQEAKQRAVRERRRADQRDKWIHQHKKLRD
ncbi:uncharacterized abhydrolase domain-containing protein DDB_G0269086-like [Drosophila tropicalis]|uniref:uncharacterized abhydrolase domain-containing protein DDB_G0269086-like n=1 Tax=Drosophila tropicalis TaxID=46794 RepID=UPI0035ABA984